MSMETRLGKAKVQHKSYIYSLVQWCMPEVILGEEDQYQPSDYPISSP